MTPDRLGPWQGLVFGAAGLLVFIGGWELAVRSGLIDAFFLPAPSSVLARMVALASGPDAVLWHDIRTSASRVLTGFVLSALVGVPLGLVMGMSARVRAALGPIVSIIRPLPALSWIPLSIDEALILSDRLVVMSARPGRVKVVYDNDLPRPRSMDVQLTDRFLALKRGIWDLVQEEVMGSMLGFTASR